MSVKKIIIAMTAGLLPLTHGGAFAGGPEILPPPVLSGWYLEGDIGYANINYPADSPNAFDFSPVVSVQFRHNNRGGLTGGGAIGYQLNRFLGLEIGGFYLPSVTTINFDSDGIFNGRGRITSWIGYAAGKLMVPAPFISNLDIFFKAGLAFTYLRFNAVFDSESIEMRHELPSILETAVVASNDRLNAMFATGLQYHFNEDWSINGQWLYVTEGGARDTNIMSHPPDHLFTFGINYLLRT